MGILNVTPDSFYQPSRFHDPESAISRGTAIFNEGADIIDIGGESTRPGAQPVSESEEIERIVPVIQTLHAQIPAATLSIDTMKPGVAKAALQAGASLINDVGGFQLPEMIELAASHKVDICVMHMQGTPQTMQLNPAYPNGVTAYLLQWFDEKIAQLLKQGIKEKHIILDPGIGFGKSVADNLEIIHNLPKFKRLGFPILLGVSRKSFLSKIINKPTVDLLPATLGINTLALLAHIDIIRVHDVKEHRTLINVMQKYLEI